MLMRRTSRRRAAWLVALAAAFALAVPARAEEAVPLSRRTRSLAAPGPERGFEVAMTVRREGRVVGEARFSAEAGRLPGASSHAGPLHWHVRDRLALGEGEEAVRIEHEAWLDGDLAPVQGTLTEGVGEDRVDHAWSRLPAGEGSAASARGFTVRVSGPSRATLDRQAQPVEDPVLTTSAFILLAGALGEEAGTFTAQLFDPTWELLLAERPHVPARIVHGPATWRDRPVHRLEVEAGGRTGLTVFVEPGARSPLHVLVRLGDGPPLELEPRGTKEPGEQDPGRPTSIEDLLDVPPTTPEAAALRTTFAFLVAEVDLFEAAIHWPRLQDLSKHGKGQDPAVFRKAILQQFRQMAPQPMPRADAIGFLGRVRHGFQVDVDDTTAVVTLPQEFGSMTLTLEAIDGVWYLVRLPGS